MPVASAGRESGVFALLWGSLVFCKCFGDHLPYAPDDDPGETACGGLYETRVGGAGGGDDERAWTFPVSFFPAGGVGNDLFLRAVNCASRVSAAAFGFWFLARQTGHSAPPPLGRRTRGGLLLPTPPAKISVLTSVGGGTWGERWI